MSVAAASGAITQADIPRLAAGEAPDTDATPKAKGDYAFSRYAVQTSHYLGWYQQWTENILFLIGRHWLQWNGNTLTYTTDTDVPRWVQRPVTNLVYAVYRTLSTKLTKQKPALEVVPPSSDSDDRESAALGQAIVEYLWRLLKCPAKLRRGIGWFLTTGQVFYRVSWDPEAGPLMPRTVAIEVPHSDPERALAGETEDRMVAADENGDPMLNDDGEIDHDAEPALMPQGEVSFEVEDTLAVRYNPEATCADDAEEMFVAKLWATGKVMEHFELTKDELPTPGSDGERELYDDLISAAAAGPGWGGSQNAFGLFGGTSQEIAIGDRSLVIEYYRKPCADYPEGRHWIVCGPKVIYPKTDDPAFPNGEAPLPDGFWPPLVEMASTPIPGQPQCLSAIGQIVPLNKQLNTLDGKIKENDAIMALGGKWIVDPADEGLIITSEPGQVLASKGYRTGHPPVQATIEALPPAIYAERGVIMDKVRTVGSLSEAETGQLPPGVTSGRAILALQEMTDSVIGPDLQALESALEEVGRRFLVLVQRYYREERTIQIRGERGKWEMRSFLGTDLSDGLDVRAQVGSSFPWSRSAQWDTKLDVLQKFPGLVMNPDGSVDQEKFSRYVDVGTTGLQAFQSDEDADLVEVEREHAMFEAIDPAKGEMEVPQLGFWQNQVKHQEAHFHFLKRDYGRFQRWTPEAQQAFLEHCRLTTQAVDELAQHMANASGAGMPTNGAPAGGPAEGADPTAPPQLTVQPGGADTRAVPPNQRPSLQSSDFRAAGGE